MKRIWAPWRITYLTGPKPEQCVFCDASKAEDDAGNLILRRNGSSMTMLNRYPYLTGHLMIVPYRHCSSLTELTADELAEMMREAAAWSDIVGRAMHPHGFNIGMNVGKAAGAGIAEHLHLHLVPRWDGDTSFIGVFDEVHVMPETLEETYRKLLAEAQRT